MSLSLFNIAVEHRQMVVRLMDLDLDEQTMLDTLEGESFPLEQKAQNITYVIRNCQFEQDAIDSEIERLTKLKAQIANREKSLRAYTQKCMEIAGVSKIAAGTFSLALQKNPASVEIFEPALIPDDYMRLPEPKPPVAAPDKKLIAQAIKDGFDVPGAKLIQSTRLVIK
jgi:hypothetical protein